MSAVADDLRQLSSILLEAISKFTLDAQTDQGIRSENILKLLCFHMYGKLSSIQLNASIKTS